MKLGIGSYTYTWAIGVAGSIPAAPMDAMALLQRAQQLGAAVVQYCDNLPLTALNLEQLEALKRVACNANIDIEVGTRGIEPENLRAHLRIAQMVGSPFVRVVVDSNGDEPAPDEVAHRLLPLIPEYRDAGVKLAIENHDRFSARCLAHIVRQLGEDCVGICLDTVNSFGALEGPDVVIQELGPYCINLHVKDFTIRRVDHQMGFVVEGCVAGQGRLNVPWLLQRLRAFGRDPNAILELWTPPADDITATIDREREWAAQSVAYLRASIG